MHAGLAALALASLPFTGAAAGEFAAVINGKSYHLDASREWNEDNLGLGLEYEFSGQSRWKKRLMVNGFRDSNDEMSYMLGGGLHRNFVTSDRLHGFYLDAGLNAFLMTRHDVNDNRPFPGILPSLTVGNRYGGINLTYLPAAAVEKFFAQDMADDTLSGIVFLQFKVSMRPQGAD